MLRIRYFCTFVRSEEAVVDAVIELPATLLVSLLLPAMSSITVSSNFDNSQWNSAEDTVHTSASNSSAFITSTVPPKFSSTSRPTPTANAGSSSGSNTVHTLNNNGSNNRRLQVLAYESGALFPTGSSGGNNISWEITSPVLGLRVSGGEGVEVPTEGVLVTLRSPIYTHQNLRPVRWMVSSCSLGNIRCCHVANRHGCHIGEISQDESFVLPFITHHNTVGVGIFVG